MTTGLRVEDEFLKEGQFLGLRFFDGWTFFRVLGKEVTNLTPYQLESALTTGSTSTSWNDIPVSTTDDRNQLAPTREHKDQIYQIFYGISPSRAQIYWQYISRQDRGCLVATRAEGGAVGHVDGEESPYRDPSIRSELFTLYDRSPSFKAYNPTPDTIAVNMNFVVAKLYYFIVKNEQMIKDFLMGQRRCKFYTVGMPGEDPVTIPSWLGELLGDVKKTPEELGIA